MVMHLSTRNRLGHVLAIALLVGACVGLPAAAQDAPPGAAKTATEPWRIIRPPQSSLVLARDGSLLGEIGSEWRTSVALATLPPHVPQAFIAIEDQRFYQHDGVDIVGIAGAIKDAVRGNPRGASTITQQLVGNMHPEIIDRSDRSLGRKLREQAAAREMEKHYTKEQILEAYLNQVHFGHRWYGVESAARHYFGKGAAELSVAEAATLAAVINGPAIYDPIRNPDRARGRRNLVLAQMAQQGFITREVAEAAQAESVTVVRNGGHAAPASYAVDVVRVQAERAGVPVSSGGYRIHTTIEAVAQRAAHEALTQGLEEIERQPGYRHQIFANRTRGSSDYLQGALVAMDPFTGDVMALVGGRDYAASPFNRAVDGKRQPGSAFKPVLYAAVIADSVPPNVLVADTAIAIPLENRTVYRPGNSDGEFLGPLTMRDALARSRNVVAVQLAQQIGMDSVIAMARAMGITSVIAPYPSSAIGASAVQPLDLVAAYATIANLGSRVEARFITHIEDPAGQVVWQNPIVQPQPVLDPTVAFIVRDMMRDVVERGTATSVRRILPESLSVAGKTGTTNDNTDVWFVGMTPGMVAGVWLGFDRPKTITPGAAGGTLAAPIWARFVAVTGPTHRSVPWQPTRTVITAELDRATGQLASDSTPPDRRYTEYFLGGTEPLLLRLDSWELLRGRRSAIR
ncbi:MAG TPA: PBP1A family penicillin-binding protein [Gemmatimonadaceae bacterium]|nr:PBP1A family penicillin-binding protein [Gemmatimonadaceae bacterium]